jgi:hypothetical protein
MCSIQEGSDLTTNYYTMLKATNNLAYLPGASGAKKKVLECSTLVRSFTKDIFMKDSIEAA